MAQLTRTDSSFADMVCADPDLLQAEFDAIVAANFGEPVRSPRGDDQAPVPSPAGALVARGRDDPPGTHLARQRSPPPPRHGLT